jgi:hypothetical protein
MGAKEHRAPIDRGGMGFVTASVIDPFGNILGIMTNPPIWRSSPGDPRRSEPAHPLVLAGWQLR